MQARSFRYLTTPAAIIVQHCHPKQHNSLHVITTTQLSSLKSFSCFQTWPYHVCSLSTLFFELRLHKVNDRPNAQQLRAFLIDFFSCRQSLSLRRGTLNWNQVGIQTSRPMNENLATWEHCLQRHKYVLALEYFKLRGDVFDKHVALAKSKPDTWQPYIAAMSPEALDVALGPASPDRLSDSVAQRRVDQTPFFSKRFVYGNALEGKVLSGASDGLLGYNLSPGPVSGVSKLAIHERWQTQPHIGRFYSNMG